MSNFRQLAGRPFNYFLNNLDGEVKCIDFYKEKVDCNQVDNGTAEILFAPQQQVIVNFVNKNTYQQDSSAKQQSINTLSIRTTTENLKDCVFYFENKKYKIISCYNTGGQDVNGNMIYHYDATRG